MSPTQLAPGEPPYVGKDRRAIVNSLRERLDKVTARRSAKMVILTGGPGQGKTRVLREFYRSLAQSQTPPPYWPEAFESTGSVSNVDQHLLGERHIISPRDPFIWI